MMAFEMKMSFCVCWRCDEMCQPDRSGSWCTVSEIHVKLQLKGWLIQ